MLRRMLCIVLLLTPVVHADLRVGVFELDASPPLGSPLAYNPAKGIQLPLSCRGVVLTGAGDPIVMMAVDWIGIGNGGQTVFREQVAKAVGTTADRVVVHALHQHDAPRCDFSADELLREHGAGDSGFDTRFARDVVQRTAAAASQALRSAVEITHAGVGEGTVDRVASNRRIMGPDGKVQHVRYTATADPKIRAFPAGTIDPQLKMISFWNQDQPLVALTYYATHPQSYYRTGLANPDFPGMARNARQLETGVPHVHFNGAGGNIGAGKWNDGAKENRQVLADRVAAGMKQAWQATRRTPIAGADVRWRFVPVQLPLAAHLQYAEEGLIRQIASADLKPATRYAAARNLAWIRRCRAKDTILVSCLEIGSARILHLPGELFVEYQLNAQKLRSDLFVAMAAYGDYGPGYIGTEIAYSQGGYETSPRASRVAPEVEGVLMTAIRALLDAE